ncbi:MAG: glycosyltransferase [Actinomycetota bacterium]|nr:glycosyltransferase [Actinomycetota bacterium]
MECVPVPRASLDDYAPFVGFDAIKRIRNIGRDLEGARVLHISSTPYGGGVAELLQALVPLMKDIGLDVTWQVMDKDTDFFTITKILHNALQGMGAIWVPEMETKYMESNRLNAKDITGDFDFVVVHDPQPAAIASILDEGSGRKGKWIWRCHLDLSNPMPEAWSFMKSLLDSYDAAIFTTSVYAPSDLDVHIEVFPPSIDPVSPKNLPLGKEVVNTVVSGYGIDLNRPLLVQVSRFDPWKDPLGVIGAFEIVKSEIPTLQLVFLGSMAIDDPEGFHYYRVTAERAKDVPDVFLLTNTQGIGNIAVNAFQLAADVVVQKSIREGFGLVVSEALWKRKAVVAGNVGGIPLQIEDGVSGFLVNSIEECAEKVLFFLNNPEARESMGRAGRERVRERFLTPRNLENYLEMFKRMSSEKSEDV